KAYLGLDVGSISTNLVVIDDRGEVRMETYSRVGGNPIASVQRSLLEAQSTLGDRVDIAGVCTTGSGRNLVGAIVGADVIKNEISAHAHAAIHLHPDVKTLFEIGGQDSKVTLVRDGVVVDFAMNLVCAAGTGSFLDSQALRLGITIPDLSERAIQSRSPTSIAGRCTVFAESDMIHKQQTGHRQEDILMGLCLAMVRNFLSNVCAGKEILPPIVLQGGVSANLGIRRAFHEILKIEPIIPKHHMVMGAYGAALIASKTTIPRTRFRGFDLCHRTIRTQGFTCPDCPNQCEVVEILDDGTLLNRSGGRCRKWEGDLTTVPLSRSAHPDTGF
ncbi:MAG: acyl-CoA dehydratase activase, partial [Kiritimatiellia bacterium]|nr:acyl-CoA dehydratase activase [Kiritimatiellia bacterium]